MKILVVAGEASADLHAGHLLAHLETQKKFTLIGVGGNHLIRLGLRPLKTPKEMAVVGLTEAIKKIPQTLRLINELAALAAKEKPDFALLLDLPDFNLRLAPKLKKMGIPVVYYISPQVWAWRSGRVNAMSECIDLLLTILPFEKPWYEKNAPEKLRVEYVGHPALEEIPDLTYAPQKNHIVIMPGSRESEWKGLLADMLGAAVMLRERNPEIVFTLPIAETMREAAENYLSPEGIHGVSVRKLGTALRLSKEPAHVSLRTAMGAWIASGTATLEAAIVGTPMVVCYRVSTTTAFIFRHFVRYTGPVAMVNLIHGGLGSKELVVPEILQEQVEPSRLAQAMEDLLAEPTWSRTKEKLAQTRKILSGTGSPVANAAAAIQNFLESRA